MLASAEGEPDAEIEGAAARLNLKLDKAAEPLPQDSVFRIRYRSAFGLKYIEIVRGTGEDAPEGFIFDGLDDGDDCELPVAPDGQSPRTSRRHRRRTAASRPRTSSTTSTTRTTPRRARRSATTSSGFGSAFAARGGSPQRRDSGARARCSSICGPSRSRLTDRVDPLQAASSRRLRAPRTSSRRSRELQAEQFAFAARTFEAISRSPDAYAKVIEQGPETLRTAIDCCPRSVSSLSNFADLSRDLNPGIADLRVALPDLNEAVEVGTPVLECSPPRERAAAPRCFRELDQLVSQETTRITLMRLEDAFGEATPLVRYVAPAQTACNYWNYWFTYFPNALSDVEPLLGNAFRQTLVATRLPRQPSRLRLGGYSGIGANGKSGPADPAGAGVFKPYEIPIINSHPYGPTGQKNADCQPGQIGYPLGRSACPGSSIPIPPTASRTSRARAGRPRCSGTPIGTGGRSIPASTRASPRRGKGTADEGSAA